MIRLVLGGDKSGKSDAGLELLRAAPAPHIFVATGKPGDLAFRAQILDHRATRSPDIPVLEAGADLAAMLRQARAQGASVLVDSLDFWLFLALQEPAAAKSEVLHRVDDFLQCLTLYQEDEGPDLIIVSSEIGLGPLAATSETRAFVRHLGGLHRQVAELCDEAFLVVAGMRLRLKGAND